MLLVRRSSRFLSSSLGGLSLSELLKLRRWRGGQWLRALPRVPAAAESWRGPERSEWLSAAGCGSGRRTRECNIRVAQ